METYASALEGCVELHPRVHGDERGSFVKIFQASVLAGLGLPTDIREQFHTRSRAGVVRGLHFQVPPHDQHKYVFCVFGAALDVAVDLRTDSPTYGQHAAFRLDADRGNGVFIPSGMAHGFAALSDDAVLLYLLTAEYAPEHDTGIHWRSAGIDWPVTDPTVSERDAALPDLADFDSPFRVQP